MPVQYNKNQGIINKKFIFVAMRKLCVYSVVTDYRFWRVS